jgi:hypothetical protein
VIRSVSPKHREGYRTAQGAASLSGLTLLDPMRAVDMGKTRLGNRSNDLSYGRSYGSHWCVEFDR